MNKNFEFQVGSTLDGCDFFDRKFAGENGAVKTDGFYQIDAFGACKRHLGAGMNLLLRGNGTDESGQTDVLNNEGIGLQGDDFLQKFGQFPKFSLENQHVHGQEGADPANAGVADHVTDIVERKVFGAASGVPVGDSKVNRIGSVFNGGFEHFTGSHR